MKSETIKQNGITLVHVCGQIPRTFWQESYHAHDHAELFIHLAGGMELFIENNVYRHNGNEIRVYAPGEFHFGHADRDQAMEWYQISLDRAFLNRHPALAEVLVNRPKGHGNVFVSKKQETIVSLVSEILDRRDSALAEHYFYANIIKILCLLNEPSNNLAVEMGKNKRLQEILEVVNRDVLSIKTVHDISARTHFSPSYIHFLFKEHLNTTPHQYVLTKKLSYAKDLLNEGASITDACFRAGFDDYANFITAFRKHFGVTPKHHKRAIQ